MNEGTRRSFPNSSSSSSFKRRRRRRTVHRVVADGVPDVLDDALPADLLDVIRVRDHEASLVVLIIPAPGVDRAPNANVLCARYQCPRSTPQREPRTYDVGVVGREQALLVCVVEVAAVSDGLFFARVPGAVLLQRQYVRNAPTASKTSTHRHLPGPPGVCHIVSTDEESDSRATHQGGCQSG